MGSQNQHKKYCAPDAASLGLQNTAKHRDTVCFAFVYLVLAGIQSLSCHARIANMIYLKNLSSNATNAECLTLFVLNIVQNVAKKIKY